MWKKYNYIISNHNLSLYKHEMATTYRAHILFSPKSSHAHIHQALDKDGLDDNFKAELGREKKKHNPKKSSNIQCALLDHRW